MGDYELLRRRILEDGKCFDGGFLKVDNFINHQIDPMLMQGIGEEFARRFSNDGANKILTIEASGIAPAIMTGMAMGLPVVFAKKKKPKALEHMLSTTVHSFTKDLDYTVCVSADFLTANDRVLIIDDFLAYGNAAHGLIELAQKAGAKIAGLGFVIEKVFQHGGDYLKNESYRVESLARIMSLENNTIKFLS